MGEPASGWRLPTEDVATTIRERAPDVFGGPESELCPLPDRDGGRYPALDPAAGDQPRSLSDLMARVRFVVVAGVRRMRATGALDEIETALAERRSARDERLVDLARSALAGEPASEQVERARELIRELEERRARHQGAVIELARETAAIEDAARAADRDWSKRDAQLSEHQRALEAQLREMQQWLLRAHCERDRLRRWAESSASRYTEAERAVFDAERAEAADNIERVTRGIGELSSDLAAMRRHRAERAGCHTERAARAVEQIEVSQLRRTVEEHAVADALRSRDSLLLAMGEHLEQTRPDAVANRLRTVDEHSRTIASMERRAVELRGVVDGVDSGSLKRSAIAVAAVLAAGVLGLCVRLALTAFT